MTRHEHEGSAVATPAADDYSAGSIQLKEGIEHVRVRPAMYIGDVHERGLHHLVNEVVDNSVDEAMAGFCTEIEVTIHDDGSISILDNGRGIPVGIHEKVGLPTLEVCLTRLGAGGKFDKNSYKVSGGLHGVGVSCVNALSAWLEAEVFRDGSAYRMRFERGKTVRELETTGPSKRRGTKITFAPDPEIFRQAQAFKYSIIAKRLRELAYLNAGLKIVLRDEREEGQSETFHFPRGIVEFVEDLSSTEDALLREPISSRRSQFSEESRGEVEVEFALQYTDTYNETILSYTNNINTIEGGTHLTGFRAALTSTLNNWLKDNEKLLKLGKDERPSGDDYKEGLVAVVSVKVPEPQFEGQTKTKLGNSDVAGVVQNVVGQYLKAWWEQNPDQAKRVVSKALEARKARLAAKKAKDLARKAKDALRGGGVAKLKDCNSTNPEECELYLVEGDSAGGTAGKARDSHTQAILPLRGKIINVWKASHDRMLGHNEIATIIQVLGTGILDDFDLAKLQYHKIIIMCDADVDGSHIRTLILTFFFRQMAELVRAGHVYIAQPPLYKTRVKRRRADGEEGEDGKKKRSKGKFEEVYHLTEQDFRGAMLGLGLDGSRLERGERDALEGGALEEVVRLAEELEQLGREVVRKGVPFDKYLGRRREDGLLPHARVQLTGAKRAPAIYTEEELEAWLAQAVEKSPDLKVWRSSDPLSEREGADVEVTVFTSKRRLEELLARAEGLGFTAAELFPAPPPEPGANPPARFHLTRGKDDLEVAGLLELPAQVRKLGERGVDVQRYKGLGEMDWDELRDTTMDPSKRILLQVSLDNENMLEANQVFSTLMGTKVEPRRAFIEKHAVEVTDLDA